MPRQPRLILPDVTVHVVQRGNDRQRCFRKDGDYFLYLLHMKEVAANAGCAVHAYCLMTNHVHLLLTPKRTDSCMVLMRNLGQRYVQCFNRRYGRSGTLWEGRFRSCLVQSRAYALACYKYIELNPVRAGLAASPADYPWSSFAANAGSREDSLLLPHPEYSALGLTVETRKAAYRSLFDVPLDPRFLGAIRDATSGGLPLGTDEFRDSLAIQAQRKLERGRPGRRVESGSDPDFSGDAAS